MATKKYLHSISCDFLSSRHVSSIVFLYSYQMIHLSLSPLTNWIPHFLDLEEINCSGIHNTQ